MQLINHEPPDLYIVQYSQKNKDYTAFSEVLGGGHGHII